MRPRGDPMPWSFLPGHQTDPGGGANRVGISVRKETPVSGQLFHVGCAVEVIQGDPLGFPVFVVEGDGGVPDSHVIDEKEEEVGTLSSSPGCCCGSR